ncbi:unnamed protein product [Allacma fusca]|uniref:Uncharacterized protein n=1 Tax=Allacma fusca TaxID=39272 RepID=A0A8J2P1U9_9HEXA|nr:unnamed protein product [Allacma fusca]
MATLAILIFLHFFCATINLVKTDSGDVGNSSLAFCEEQFYVPKSKQDCPYGFSFVGRVPKCVCIKGIYRMYLSNCEVADGFAEEVCTLLEDQQVQVRGVKLTKEPKWDRTGVACERGSAASKEWEYTPEHAKVRTPSTEFYTINGEAFITTQKVRGKWKHDVCVQNKQQEQKICLYRHKDNVDIWHLEKQTEIQVKQTCTPGKAGSTFTPLRVNKCFNPLTLYDAECQVPCIKDNIRQGDGSGNKSPQVSSKLDLDAHILDAKPYIHYDNDFYDRKLNTYLMQQELGVFNVTLVSTVEHGPNKTFSLFEIMKNITKNYCPQKYVPSNWVDQVVDLFHNLHHGDIFKYENELGEEEYKWISDILKKCYLNQTKIKLYHEPLGKDDQGNPIDCDGTPKATGYCNSTSGCDQVPVYQIPPPYNDFLNKHYVPEVNWLILDIVHVACFPQFNESYRMFHLLEQTVEKLFTLRIKNYWFWPSWSQKTKGRMLSTAADDLMHNLEVCAESAYQYNNRQPHRLVRPDPSKYLKRRKRAAQLLSTSYDITCAKSRPEFTYPKDCENFQKPKNKLINPKIKYI